MAEAHKKWQAETHIFPSRNKKKGSGEFYLPNTDHWPEEPVKKWYDIKIAGNDAAIHYGHPSDHPAVEPKSEWDRLDEWRATIAM